MEKLTNDQNIKNLKTRKILRIFIMIFCVLTIVLALISLIFDISVIYPLITFIIATILINKRDKTTIKISEDLEKIRIEKSKDKQKKKIIDKQKNKKK